MVIYSEAHCTAEKYTAEMSWCLQVGAPSSEYMRINFIIVHFVSCSKLYLEDNDRGSIFL